MVEDSKKRNVYAILFFLAILFVAIGFERNGALAGLAVRQSASYPEIWYLSCTNPTPLAAGQDLGKELFETFGYQRGKTADLCAKATDNLQLGRGVTARVSCASLTDKQQFVLACKDQVNILGTSSSRTATRRR